MVHVEKLRDESPKSIKKAWLRFHRKTDSLASVLEAPSFARLVERTTACPMFVFPVPDKTKTGFRSMLFQAVEPHVHLYTELEMFKQRGAAAPAALSCVFYDDLAKDKGLVLMRGQVDLAMLSPTDAAFLANQATIWYFDEARYELVRQFNHRPAEFNFDRVVQQMQRL